MASVEQKTVATDEQGMRLDRWFKVHYPGLGFGALQKLLRSGQVRVDGGRVKSDTRLAEGQTVRIPPMGDDKPSGPVTAGTMRNEADYEVLRKMILFEDDKVLVFNKPQGLSVQGGSNVHRHVDGMLDSMKSKKGEKPRLVHRLDRDTTGVLIVAKTRGAAQKLTAAFRERETRKIYWALCKGMPPKKDGRISTWLVKEQTPDGDRMRVVKHGEPGADHAVTHFRLIERTGQRLSWMEFEPYTGRTHQLRVHSLFMGNPIIGDPKYFDEDPHWDFPGGIQKKLHLHARSLTIPHPSGGWINVEAPLPPHMVQSWNLLGLNEEDGVREED